MKTTGIYTQKALQEMGKILNAEHRSIFGCIKSMCESDALTSDCKKVLAYIAGTPYKRSKEFREALATRVLANTPLYACKDGKQVAYDLCKRKGAKVYAPRTSWTFNKVLQVYRVLAGTLKRTDVTNIVSK